MARIVEPADLSDLIRRYESGVPLSKIGKEVGIADKALKRSFVAAGVRIRTRAESIRLARGPAPDMAAIAERYRAGESVEAIARDTGITANRIRLRLADCGVALRSAEEVRRKKKVVIHNLDDLAARYEAGEALYVLAEEAGVSRKVLQDRFESHGVELRTYAEAQRTKWVKILADDPAAGRKTVAAANEARRGNEDPLERKIRRANTNYRRLLHRGAHEDELAALLRGAGLEVQQQFQVGPYNLDLALHGHGVAVEVLGRPLERRARARFRQRTEYLLDRGWRLVFILCKWNGVAVGEVAEQVVALANLAGREESAARQYWVIGSDGELLPTAGMDLDDLAVILGPKSAQK